MDTLKKTKLINSIIIGATTAVLFIIAITITADLYLPLKDWMKNNFYHHWVGKGILSIVVLVIVSILARFLPISSNQEKTGKILMLLSGVLIFGFFAIFGFYIFEVLWK
ncbi:MAG: hypothetical protein AAB596_01835 [Patescibacteria group bacterium]